MLVRNLLEPVALCGDIIKHAFSQVRIREADRETLRFHWNSGKDSSEVDTLRFMQALFGLVQSRFLLTGTLKQLLEALRNEYSKQVEEIMRSLYVDDIITGEDMLDQG